MRQCNINLFLIVWMQHEEMFTEAAQTVINIRYCRIEYQCQRRSGSVSPVCGEQPDKALRQVNSNKPWLETHWVTLTNNPAVKAMMVSLGVLPLWAYEKLRNKRRAM